MTLLFCDSFDHYGVTNILEKWGSKGGTTHGIGTAYGRNGTQGLRLANTRDCWVKTPFPSSNAHANLIAGCSWKKSVNGGDTNVMGFWDGATPQVNLICTAGGQLQVVRGQAGTGTVLGTCSLTPSNGVKYYLELKVTINATTGTVDVVADGVNILSLTAQNTAPSGTNSAKQFQLGGADASIADATQFADYDDVYVCNASGSVNNNFLGDTRIEYRGPSAAGNYAQWTPLASTNVSQVSEALVDNDASYNATNVVNNRDSFACQDMSVTPGTILAVVHVSIARADQANLRTIKPGVVRIGSTDYDGGTNDGTIGVTYKGYQNIRETNPATSAPWTLSDVNGMEIGYKLVS